VAAPLRASARPLPDPNRVDRARGLLEAVHTELRLAAATGGAEASHACNGCASVVEVLARRLAEVARMDAGGPSRNPFLELTQFGGIR